jgi:zinc transport system permease protein
MSYLFGSILSVPDYELWLILALNAAIVGLVGYFYNDFLALSFDEEFARVRGVPVRFLYFLLLGMIALSVVAIIRVVGLILVIALLTIPPYIAERYAGSLKSMMWIATGLSVFFNLAGLWLSYAFNLTSGASIIMVAGVCFFADQLLHAMRRRRSA